MLRELNGNTDVWPNVNNILKKIITPLDSLRNSTNYNSSPKNNLCKTRRSDLKGTHHSENLIRNFGSSTPQSWFFVHKAVDSFPSCITPSKTWFLWYIEIWADLYDFNYSKPTVRKLFPKPLSCSPIYRQTLAPHFCIPVHTYMVLIQKKVSMLCLFLY